AARRLRLGHRRGAFGDLRRRRHESRCRRRKRHRPLGHRFVGLEDMDYLDYLRLLEPTHSDLAAELRALSGLGGVMQWMARRGLDLRTIEIIAQDEFSLDFILPLAEAGPFLVFGIT